MQVESIDHLVLTVRDVDASCAFYTRVLGMTISTFGAGRKALVFGRQKINLHQAGRELEPRAAAPTPGAADLCFVSRLAPAEVMAHLQRCGVTVLEGPVPRTGAAGPISSVYFRDLDGNLIEVCNYAGVEPG